MDDRYEGLRKALEDAVLSGPANTEPSLRHAAAARPSAEELPEALRLYVDKVRRHAYQVTDEDVVALTQAGYSDDQLFELTVSAALGAALKRLEAGLGALRGGGHANRKG